MAVREAAVRRPVAVTIAVFGLVLLRALPAGTYVLDPLRDGLLLGIGVPAAAITEYLVNASARDVLGTADRDDVNALDALAIADYSEAWSTTGDVLVFVTVLASASYAVFLDLPDFVTGAVIYAETLALANTAKNLVKLAVPRYRPYMYSGGAEGVDPSEKDQSFVSGDATISFAAATAAVTMFATYFPGSRWLVPVAAGSYGLAGFAAASRVIAGKHFITDVTAGAILGTAIGYAVPALHRRGSADRGVPGVVLSAAPGGLAITWSY